MKICLVGPAYPLRGGIANFNEALAHSLIKEGHTVEIISFSLQYPNFLFPGKTQYDETGTAPAGLNIKTIINSINPFTWLKAANYIKKTNPDFVVVRFWIPYIGLSLGSLIRMIRNKVKVIALTDNVIPHENRAGDELLTKYFLGKCHAFMCMSKSVKDDILTFNVKGEIEVSPHPIYNIYGDKVEKLESRKVLELDPNEKIILFFGLIREYKGLDLLLKAMADPAIKQKKIKLIVAGEFYDNQDKYLTLVDELGINGEVTIKNEFIASEMVKYYFCAADLIVQPYKTATQSGITQIGFHFERPMLVTRVGGLPEIIQHDKDGYVVDTDPESIAQYISKYYDESKEVPFSAALKTSKERFSWNYFNKKLIHLSKNIVQ
jgi:glycosyltransferase involved in cell wall biosynthesis